jgi:PAS domain S-box-containing protein
MGAGRDLYGQRKDGSEFPVEIGLNPIETDEGRLVLASIVDITERKRADEKFRLAVESAPNAMVMVNEQGQIILANLQAEKLFGYSRAELESLPIESLVPDRFRASHPAYRQSYSARPVARAMGSGRDLFARRKDGTEFPVEIGLNPIQTAEGLHILGAIVDITQRKQLERQAREQLVELAHVSRLTTVGEMFSGLAHEINQPLGAAANYARACVRFAKSGAATPEELIEYMEKAAIENGRACEIVNRMRAFVRKDFSPPAPVDINEIVEYVVTLLDAGMRTGVNAQAPVTPRLELTTPLPRVSAVRVQIEQVLVNLARNAVEAMAESSSPSRELSIRSWRDQDFVCVAVADTGPGVAPEQLTNLFKPFFSTKHHGMGLGLSISRSIAEAHQGRLDVESTLGEGTTFCLKLPIARVEETP